MSDENPSSEPYLSAARDNVLKRVRRRRRAVSVAIVGCAVVVALSATGATLAATQISSQEARTSVVCYAHDNLNSLSGTIGGSVATNLTTGVTQAPTSVNKAELCATIWNEGIAQAAANGGHWPLVDPNSSNFPVPTLAYCILNNGETAGFPVEAPATTTAEVCENLGLPVDSAVK